MQAIQAHYNHSISFVVFVIKFVIFKIIKVNYLGYEISRRFICLTNVEGCSPFLFCFQFVWLLLFIDVSVPIVVVVAVAADVVVVFVVCFFAAALVAFVIEGKCCQHLEMYIK